MAVDAMYSIGGAMLDTPGAIASEMVRRLQPVLSRREVGPEVNEGFLQHIAPQTLAV